MDFSDALMGLLDISCVLCDWPFGFNLTTPDWKTFQHSEWFALFPYAGCWM